MKIRFSEQPWYLSLLMTTVLVILLSQSCVSKPAYKPGSKADLIIKGTNEGKVATIDEGLKSGEDINYISESGDTALILSISKNNLGITQFLIENGANVNLFSQSKDGYGGTPIMAAAIVGNIEAVQLLLNKGADPNYANQLGITALILSAMQGNHNVSEMLINKGAKVNHQDSNGSTALMAAATNGNVYAVNLLLEKGADVNLKMTSEVANGSTALAGAAGKGHTQVVKQLLGKGAEVNTPITLKGKYVTYPLIGAAMNGYTDIVGLLIRHGADIKLKTSDGRSALDFAKERGHSSTVRLLENCQ